MMKNDFLNMLRASLVINNAPIASVEEYILKANSSSALMPEIDLSKVMIN